MPSTSAGFGDGEGALGRDVLARYGPTLSVQVGFDQSFRTEAGGRPNLPELLLPALVDTGTAVSCIDSTLAVELGLPVVNRARVAGIHGTLEADIHLAQIHMPALGATEYGRFAGVHLAAGGQPHAVLIGRSFLRHFTMVYEGRTGAVTVSDD